MTTTSLIFAAGGGKIISTSGSAHNVIMQSDGKILVVGRTALIGSQTWGQIERYNRDGSLDTTFSGDGVFNLLDVIDDDPPPPLWVWNKFSNSVALQADGKIVVAGHSGGVGTLVRFNADGSIHEVLNGFSSDSGCVTTPSYYNSGVTIQSDGKILVVGQSKAYGSLNDFVLMRYNPDGRLDSSFSGDGVVTTDFFGYEDIPTTVALQSDGKIVVAGRSSDNNHFLNYFTLVRYNTDGSLDTSFSGDGKVTTDFGGVVDALWSMTLQSDGKVVVVGQHFGNQASCLALLRYNTDGSLDTSFSNDGKVILLNFILTEGYSGNDVAVQLDGKILVAGCMDNDFALVRFNTDGTLDTGFSGDGIVTTDFGNSIDQATCVTLQNDGKIVVAGYKSWGEPYSSVLIARYNTDGSLDTSFTGIADTTAPTVNTFTPADGATGVAVDHNIVFDFSESIQRGTGTITIHSGSVDGPVVESYNAATSTNLTLSGSTLTINPTADLVNSNHYYVTFSAGSVKDLAGNSYAGTTSYDFTTEAPILTPMLRNGISVMPERYTGPATAAGGAAIHFQYIGDSTGEVVIGTPYNDFINVAGGVDAVNAGAGNDVIDGGTGSNFLTGGAGTDIFFSDGRGGVTTWSTITDWQAGEQLSVWGWHPGTSRIVEWTQAGAAGYEGLTMHADLNGDGTIDTSVTFTGITSQSQLPDPLEFEGVLWFT